MSTQNELLRDAEKTLDTSDLRISFEDACRLSSRTMAEYIKSVRLEGRQFDEAEMETVNRKLREALAEVGWTVSELADEARNRLRATMNGIRPLT